ncbi:anthranilate synthase component I family protein [Roseofilum sp. Belize Diploria]|uniref:anthranilate synthase component I family protein n=2 Tax=unclassified Roseofilum TaxID=2620099 RepID=UPI000E81AD30|nr:chorismate-binding protein [Roseofilum sp. Belize Diploria]MBP0007658.1 chorismate-binding protein [Roseofilum sp. Belize Diploria]MBP0033540.1 chorismate-binding protein [Roseofilum sp. Belize BBD 4]HBR00169.1 salicylate synthase [Cyanobacteria bacterium UBA11691]
MNNQVKDSTKVKYREQFFPNYNIEPLTVLSNLKKAGMINSYLLYEGEDEVRIAIGEYRKIAVSRDRIEMSGNEVNSQPIRDPFKQVEEMLNTLPLENWTAYGYVSFDMASFYSSYSKQSENELLYLIIPDSELIFIPEGICYRSIKGIDEINTLLTNEVQLPTYTATPISIDFSDRQDYEHRVAELIAAIKANRLQKAIISRTAKYSGQLNVLGTYSIANQANNAYRSYAFDLGKVKGVGFSPEILMKAADGRWVVTNPLAGTRPRGETPEKDLRLYAELFADAKEVKEHALSAWLAQQEMASVCLPNSVGVFNFMEIKKYRCVQHLSSRVGGLLQPNRTLWDALKVLFPGITVSGIDKQQALYWIDRLEDEPRSLYAGTLGWVSSNGTADFALAIRSVFQYGDTIHLNAGAGIIAESVPGNEYIESVNKMNTMLANLVIE